MGSGMPFSHQKVANSYENYMIIRDVFTSPKNLMENSDIRPIHIFIWCDEKTIDSYRKALDAFTEDNYIFSTVSNKQDPHNNSKMF